MREGKDGSAVGHNHLINPLEPTFVFRNEADGLPTANTRVLVNTAYGGRLVLRLPAGTLLFVHLKDKKLIRHKKRWSQVCNLLCFEFINIGYP